MFALYIPELPDLVKNLVDDLLGPVSFFVIAIVAFCAMIQFRGFWTRGWFIGSVALFGGIFYLWSLTDTDFRLIVAKDCINRSVSLTRYD